MAMHLYLSANRPWNTNFCNAEGQVIYTAESPMRFSLDARPIIIKRILPSNVDLETDNNDSLRDSFSHLAEIDYNALLTSRIRYNGMDMATSEFFRNEGGNIFRR